MYNDYVVNLSSHETHQISFLCARGNKARLVKYEPAQRQQQRKLELGGGATPDLFDAYLKLTKFFGSSDALKVISEGCIATSRNMARAYSQITLNKSCNSGHNF